jgi:hypothetical protein
MRTRDAVRFEHDLECQRFVAEHPGGATLDEVGQFFGGLSRERIRQIEIQALGKLRAAGVSLAVFRLPHRATWVDRMGETGV